MAELNSLFDDAQRLAGEQFEAAWQLHVDRVAETLESGWRENIARVVEQRFADLKAEIGAANEVHVAEQIEAQVQSRLDGEWAARLEDHRRETLTEEFQRRLNEGIQAEIPGRIDYEVSTQVQAQLAARLEEEVASRLAEIVPERVQQCVSARLAEEIPIHVAIERANWDAEFLPLVEQTRDDVQRETATKTRDAARRELGLQLSQALRVLRQSTDGSEWKEAFLDAVQPFCALAALFLVTKDRFSLEGIRGMEGELETGFDLEFEEAAAFHNSLESKDIVVAARTDSEVSPYVMSLRPGSDASKCFLFPVLVGDVVAALLYVEPAEQPLEVGAIETLVTAAGLTLQSIRAARAVQSSSLVNIASALNPASALNHDGGDAFQGDRFVPAPELVPAGAFSAGGDGTAPASAVAGVSERSFNWETLTQEQRELHMRAQRFARVQVAEMRLYKDDAVKAGRRDANIYLRLRTEIDEARERYLAQFLDGQPHMRDYLHGELVETLAIDNPQLMGPDYPDSLV